jgi:hypothetical protein
MSLISSDFQAMKKSGADSQQNLRGRISAWVAEHYPSIEDAEFIVVQGDSILLSFDVYVTDEGVQVTFTDRIDSDSIVLFADQF